MGKKDASKKDINDSTKKQTGKGVRNASNESEEQRKAKQKQAIENLNRENLDKYLKSLQIPLKNEETANRIAQKMVQLVEKQLSNGSLLIAETVAPLPQKVKQQPELTYDQRHDLQVKAKRELIIKKRQYFYEQLRGKETKLNHSKSGQIEFKEILTKQEHQRKVRQIQQEKQERERRIEEAKEEEHRKLKQQEQQKKILQEEMKKKNKIEKMAKIQQNLKKRKQEQDKQKQIQNQFKLQNQPHLYEKMEKRYQSQILLPYLQEKKIRLKEIRQFRQKYDVQAVKQHERQYLQNSVQRSRPKQQQKSWNYKPPAKTERLTSFLQAEKTNLQNQLQARQRRIEDMQQKQQIFLADLKQNYKPKIDPQKKAELQERIAHQYTHRSENNPDQRQIGINYLQIAKKMRRSQSVRNSKINEQLILQPQPVVSISRLKNHSQQFYEDARRKKMEEIINSEESTISQKYNMLKWESQKLGTKLRQKETLMKIKSDSLTQKQTTQLLLSSITAKIGLVKLLKD